MTYVKNAWYVAAWDHEIEDGKRPLSDANLLELLQP